MPERLFAFILLLCLLTACAAPTTTSTPTVTITATLLPSATPNPTSTPSPTPIPEPYTVLDGKAMLWDGTRYRLIMYDKGQPIEAKETITGEGWVVFLDNDGGPVAVAMGDNLPIEPYVAFQRAGERWLGQVDGKWVTWDEQGLEDLVLPEGTQPGRLAVSDQGVFIQGDKQIWELLGGVDWSIVGWPKEVSKLLSLSDKDIINQAVVPGGYYALMDIPVREMFRQNPVRLVDGVPVILMGESNEKAIIARYGKGDWGIADFTYHYSPDAWKMLSDAYYELNTSEWEYVNYQVGDKVASFTVEQEVNLADLARGIFEAGMKITDGEVRLLINYGKGELWIEVVPSSIGFHEHVPVDPLNPKTLIHDAPSFIHNYHRDDPLSFLVIGRLVYLLSDPSGERLSSQLSLYANDLESIKEILAGRTIIDTDFNNVLAMWKNGKFIPIRHEGPITSVSYFPFDASRLWYQLMQSEQH